MDCVVQYWKYNTISYSRLSPVSEKHKKFFLPCNKHINYLYQPTSELGVLNPTVAAPPGTWRAGSCTKDNRHDWFRANNWTWGERNTSDDSSSPERPGTSSPSTTNEESRWAPTPNGKCHKWFMMWLVICGCQIFCYLEYFFPQSNNNNILLQ